MLIILMLFQNRPGDDQCGPRGRPHAREHSVGDPCSRFFRTGGWQQKFESSKAENNLVLVHLFRFSDAITHFVGFPSN